MKNNFEVLEIGGLFYATLFDENGKRLVTDGPYPEKWQAESMMRMRDM